MTALDADRARRLYDGAPDGFLSRRTELSAELRSAGDPDAARAVKALRKPTVAAATVNRQVWADPSGVGRLADLRRRLLEAHATSDATAIRDLSTERRAVIGELTEAALTRAGGTSSSGTRDEVHATFDAAVADPSVAAELGRLDRARRWDGLGIAPDDTDGGPPSLVLVRGGAAPRRRVPAKRAASATTAATAATAATTASTTASTTTSTATSAPKGRTATPARDRGLERARAAAGQADEQLRDCESAVAAAEGQVGTLRAEAARVRTQLDRAERALLAARKAARAARTRHRTAHTALDRAQR